MARVDSNPDRPDIVVIGGGFAGLNFAKRFRGDARITLVDRQNHHVFQPLLYQVATASLSAPDIAQPLRSILRRYDKVKSIMAAVTGIDPEARTVRLDVGETLHYDYLVYAAGSRTSYFGHPEWGDAALGLKTIDDALAIRKRILSSFERAEVTEDAAERRRLMTMVVIGGGPTGVELAGALAELTKVAFRHDFRRINPSHAQVILIEGGGEVLEDYPSELSRSAARQLERLGVTLRFGHRVTNIEGCTVHVGAQRIDSANIFWTAGVEATPLVAQLGAEQDRAGRVKVNGDLTAPGRPEIYVLGDAAHVEQDGRMVPGIAPAAIQMGRFCAKALSDRVAGRAVQGVFRYRDRGMMATIGRKAAVAVLGPLRLSGLLAWVTWLVVHLLFLLGLRNKVVVVTNWVWAYFTWGRGARVIFGRDRDGRAC